MYLNEALNFIVKCAKKWEYVIFGGNERIIGKHFQKGQGEQKVFT